MYNVQLNLRSHHITLDIYKIEDNAIYFIYHSENMDSICSVCVCVKLCFKIDVRGITFGLNIGNVNIIELSDWNVSGVSLIWTFGLINV